MGRHGDRVGHSERILEFQNKRDGSFMVAKELFGYSRFLVYRQGLWTDASLALHWKRLKGRLSCLDNAAITRQI
jgi:hypothetical protein